MPKTNSKVNKKREVINSNLVFCSESTIDEVFAKFGSSKSGLTDEQAEDNILKFGKNIVSKDKKVPVYKKFLKAFLDPFTFILVALAVVSLITDVILQAPKDQNWLTFIIITIMILASGLLRFVQELRSNNAAQKLKEMVRITVAAERGGKKEIPLAEVAAGDIIYLAAGDMVPADVRVISCKDLFLKQSALTGESEPIEKFAVLLEGSVYHTVTERENIAFMGSTVISGSAVCVAVAVGEETLFGQVAKLLADKPEKTSFEKGISSVSWILIRFMFIMVPIVFLLNGFTKGDWLQALLFAISVAVGLTPEMLPMIVTTSLAKGAIKMAHKKTIIKSLNSVQNFGAMDILCTDKTGTLTQDKVVLQRHMDVHGAESTRVLKYAFLNSYYQTGLKNLMDIAIIDKTNELSAANEALRGITDEYTKIDEIPFDFTRRMMSVVVKDKSGRRKLLTKGAVEEILAICNFVEYENMKVLPLTDELKAEVLKTVDELNNSGMRVLALAQKTDPPKAGAFGTDDECDMVLVGYLAFLDPPKDTTRDAIKALKEYGVDVKILTGDNEKVTAAICRDVGIKITNILLGSDVLNLSDEELKKEAERANVFAKLSPDQKARVVRLLRENGHVVGYMGDGINDAAAMKAADVGISVDTAVDIAKESAHIILLEKDLMVLEQGIIEGRKIYANMIKYIKMTAASNFGNMFSVLAASAFLPFLPMLPIHLVLLNLIYDVSCASIPWDNVDKEFLQVPRRWEAKSITRFMLWLGPYSSISDILTFIFMYFLVCPAFCGGTWSSLSLSNDTAAMAMFIGMFQAGWFIESMLSQTLVLHLLRSPKLPFIKSRASLPLTLITALGVAVVIVIPFTPVGTALGMVGLPAIYFLYLAIAIAVYIALTILLKYIYVRRYKELL